MKGWTAIARPLHGTRVFTHSGGMSVEVSDMFLATSPPDLLHGFWEAVGEAAREGAAGRHAVHTSYSEGGGWFFEVYKP